MALSCLLIFGFLIVMPPQAMAANNRNVDVSNASTPTLANYAIQTTANSGFTDGGQIGNFNNRFTNSFNNTETLKATTAKSYTGFINDGQNRLTAQRINITVTNDAEINNTAANYAHSTIIGAGD